MYWIIGVSVVLLILFFVNTLMKKRQQRQLKSDLNENWGERNQDEHYDFSKIGRYFENNTHKAEAYNLITDKCNIDLDLDDVFTCIDRTTSKIGQQYLYFKMRTIGRMEDLIRFDSLANMFEENPALRLDSQVALSPLNSDKSYYLEELIHGLPIAKPRYMWAIYASTFWVVSCIIGAFLNPGLILLVLPLFILNMVFHYKNKANISYYLNGVSQLGKSLKVGKALAGKSEIQTFFDDLLFIKRVDTLRVKTSFISFEKNLENDFMSLFWALGELLKILFNLEILIFFNFIDSIKKEKEAIEKLFVFIGEVDAAISVTALRADDIQTCTPTFITEKRIVATNLIHPLIEECIPNDLTLLGKSMLLTGSNMSGKTTFIRTLAINSILAQTLHTCFAETYEAQFFKVYSSIRISDDLLENTSYYLQEVLTIKALIEAAVGDEPCLFVLDEIFKGTNTIERISGGKAILSYLNQQNHMVLVSTHDIELTSLLAKDNYDLFHFTEQILEDNLFFDHKLKEGKLKTRNAIRILELYDYPPEIIVDAREVEQAQFLN